MDNLQILPHALWYQPNACHSVDKSLIYASFSKIVYVPSKNKENEEIEAIEIKSKVISFSVDPDSNWSKNENKFFALLDGEYVVSVYDFAGSHEFPVQGHRGHVEPHDSKMDNKVPSTICWLHNKQIISTKNCTLIKYCMVSNTFKVFRDFSKKSPITAVKASEFDQNLFVVGTKFGMILITQVDTLEIKQKVRGHDSEITCLDWISFDGPTKREEAAPKQPAKLEMPKNDDDLFDIYSFDHLEDEFGAYREKIEVESDDELDLKDQAASNSNFDFIEACQSLKSEILGENRTEADMVTYANPEIDLSMDTYELNEHQYGVKNLNDSHNQSMESIPSATPPSFSEASLKCALEAEPGEIEEPKEIPERKSSVFLMSGGKENFVGIWDTSSKTYVSLAKKITWTNKGKLNLPGTFTQFVWIDNKTLIVTDGNGDLLEFNVNYNEAKKDITVQKTSKIFPVKGVLNIVKTADHKELWTSSIYRQICCLDVKANTEIIKYDTIQTRINYILPNPIDSNILALSGFDKRLWNLSDVSDKYHITLQGFMSKVCKHSGVISLSWHPSDDNILAFGSREGRIGYFFTKNPSMAPVMLKSFTNHEIYSISFAKVTKNSKEVVMLLACDTHRFVYYTQRATSKIEAEYNEVKYLEKTSSVAVNGDIVAVGTQAGMLHICDIVDNFKVLRTFKISSKYISQMDWHQQKLVLCADLNVHQFDLSGDFRDPKIEIKSRVAKGHTNRTCGVRYNKSGTLMVSTCFGGQIKVWDLEKEEIICLSNYDFDTQIFTAIFMPINEEIIVFGGLHCTVHTYNWKNYGSESKPKPIKVEKAIEWGKICEELSTTVTRHTKRKIAVKVENKIVQEVAEELQNVKLENIPKKSSTLFYLCNKEITSDPWKLMKKVLSDEYPETYNQRIFSTREDVKKLINDEFMNYKDSATKTIGSVILPMLNDDLKAEILKKVSAKTLTEQDLALAPSISYSFWKNCSEAYGLQCLNTGETLKAIPYLLACDETDATIKYLCENDYYREAYIVAKLRKDAEDPIFGEIFDKWTQYYGRTGFYEAEATLYCCTQKFDLAQEALLKRKSQPEEYKEILEALAAKSTTS